MEEWKEYKLGEIADCTLGKMLDQRKNKGKPRTYLGNVAVRWGSFNIDPSQKMLIEDEEIPKFELKLGDIVICEGGEPGRCAIWESDSQMFIQKALHRVRTRKDVANNYFVYYCFRNLVKQGWIDPYFTGSTIKHLPRERLVSLILRLPSLPAQKTIACILKSLDDKIEVNRRINENLEQQAQVLFKSWFVDFEPFKDGEFVETELGMIPKGWRVVSLDEMTSKFGTGLNPRKNFKLGEGTNYYVTIKNMGNNRVYLDDKCDKVTDEAIEKINKRSKLQAGDLLFSGIGTIGRVALITETPKNWNTSESVFNMHPAENISSVFLYILLLSDVFQQYVKQHAQGGVQQGIRMASLKEYKMALPNNDILREFDKVVVPLVSLVKINESETDRLATLRDTLLPRLMSGELSVNDVKM